MPLKFMYITNRPEVARIAERYGVDRIWVDLETRGKEERQKNMNTVKSNHTMLDVSVIRTVLTTSQLLVRVNPLFEGSKEEIAEVIDRGADIVMLPMLKTASDAERFVSYVAGRARTMLLVETREAEVNIDQIAAVKGVDEIHIGLNDLHFAYGMDFMFELLTNGHVDALTKKIAQHGIPFGFGGIARLDEGMVPARHIIAEHYRLGSSMAILSRSFYDSWIEQDTEEIEQVFQHGMNEIREFEQRLQQKTPDYFSANRASLQHEVSQLCGKIKRNMDYLQKHRSPALDASSIHFDSLNEISQHYGDAFYLLNSEQFKTNYQELRAAFRAYYPKFEIAYSYKTNYIPKLCKLVNELGGYAEVVSDMEWEIARRVGVPAERVIWNGPYKNPHALETLPLEGGTVNVDSISEMAVIAEIAENYPDIPMNLGIRVNFDIADGVTSRFGFDIESQDFHNALKSIQRHKNLYLIGMHCHFATRSLETWKPRAEGMLRLIDQLGLKPRHIDLGGGLFGKMGESLKAQFASRIPTYDEYAREAATVFMEYYKNVPEDDMPLLLVEPGSALAGDVMQFAARVTSIKNVRGKAIATVLGSIYNINPTLNKKNPPIHVYQGTGELFEYKDLDFGGFTCIESDYLYRHYDGQLSVGDFVVFDNVGSYSVVLKPPFILPNFAVLDIGSGRTELIKRAEVFDDLFSTYVF